MKNFSKLEKKLGVLFNNTDLLRQSLVHKSYINENPHFELDQNERLEFLGDAVLELVVTEYLFKHYPRTPEGEMTNWRASLVNASMLTTVATEFNLYEYLYLSKGEKKDQNIKARQYILANAFEALIGALYIDQGLDTARDFIEKNIIVKLPHILKNQLYVDAKTRFQELAQEKEGITPTYNVIHENGPDHAKEFTIGVYLNDELIAKGSGLSKQEAQMQAATNALAVKKWIS